MASHKFKLALIQLTVTSDRDANNRHSVEMVEQAAKNGAKIISLPEFCNVAYSLDLCAKLAEPIPGGPSTEIFSKLASDNKIYLIAASIPELHDGKVYNTSAVFGPDGKMIAKHQKFHLFDVNVPGRITHQESKVMSPGAGLTMFDTEYCKVGIGICYDMRFAEMAQIYARKGCQLLIYPGAFSMTTGPAHWELLVRARAVDNQCYAAAVAPARDPTAHYTCWGHSTIVSPWGDILATADENEHIVYADVDLEYLKEVRNMLPTTAQRRNDFYDVIALVEPATHV